MKNKMILVMALCVAFFAAVPSLKADPVDVAIARKVAVNFLIQKSGHVCPDLVDVTAQMPFGNMYFFVNPQGRGFVIVAADDRVFPILGYSTENNFEIADLPQHIESWYRQYDNEIARIIADDIEATDDILDEWARLIKGNPEPASRMREKSVAPLLTTTWGQGSATTVPSNWTYNYFCPDSSGKKALAGCTAVATAQVMKYWNHPAVGHGSRTYTPNNASFGQQSANFANTTYAWSDMPNSLSTTSDTTERNAVATLLYHVGVAVNMNYGVSGSSAPTVNGGNVTKASSENALISYFKYSSSVHSVLKADFSDADWIALLKSELDASTPRPIIYSGWDASAGHSFVLDGYNVLHQFHINWGWRGNYDGYYTMGALNPSNSGTGGNSSSTYNRSNQAVIGIQPISNTGSTSAVTATTTNAAWGSVSGVASYNNYDTVTLLVNTEEGYRFKKWSDGSHRNPRTFIINDNVSFHADLEQIIGDTLYYNNSPSRSTSIGVVSGNTYYWGVKFPPSSLTANSKASKILFYAPIAGTYNLSLYNDGDSVPGNMLCSGDVVVSSSQRGYIKVEVDTNNAIINANNPLWVVFRFTNNDTHTVYPAAVTYYAGNEFSKMRSSNGISWSALSYKNSWMIQLVNERYGSQEAITEATIEDGYTITNGKGIITVTGAEEETVRFIDNTGRVLATDNSHNANKTFNAPANGVYLIQVGNKPAKKIVVTK